LAHGGLGQSDQDRLGLRGERDVDLDLNGCRVNSDERVRGELGEHGRYCPRREPHRSLAMNHRAAPNGGRSRKRLPCRDGLIIPRGKQSPGAAYGPSLPRSSRTTMTSSRAPENPLRWGTDMALATQPWRAYWLRASSRRGRSNRPSKALSREVRSL